MQRRGTLLSCGSVVVLALVLGGAAVQAKPEKRPKLVVRQVFGPVSVEPGDTVRLSAFNLLPNAGGSLTFTLLDAITGDPAMSDLFIVGPGTGESITWTTSGSVGNVVGLVRFESGDTSAFRGPALAASLQLFDPSLETKLYEGGVLPFVCTGEAF